MTNSLQKSIPLLLANYFLKQDDSDIEHLEKKIGNVQNNIPYFSGLVTKAALDTKAIEIEKYLILVG